MKQIAFVILPKTKEYQKFVILCAARSGSTWLHTLLNSHPNVHSQGEIIRENHHGRKLPFTSIAFNPCPRLLQAVGLKVFYDDPLYKVALEAILADPTIKIVLLRRKTKLAQFVSNELARSTAEWTRKNLDSNATIAIDSADFYSFKAQEQATLTELERRLRTHQVHPIAYEDLVQKKDEVLLDLQRFLGVAPRTLSSLLEKQGAENVTTQISNWEEVKNELHKEIQ